MSQFVSGQIMNNSKKKEIKCCLHKNIIPLEFSFFRKIWPDGYKNDPHYNAVNILSADAVRVKAFLCLDCKREIKAPTPDSIKKDRL